MHLIDVENNCFHSSHSFRIEGDKMRFLGIDGGGTKTEFLIIDENGETLSHCIRSSCHYKQTSLLNFKNVLKEGIDYVCKKANTDLEDIDYGVLGIPGYGCILEDIDILNYIVGEIFPTDRFKCVNDGEIAWAGSLAFKPGINIVSGTGCIGFGVNQNGLKLESGGWGSFCGDEGSGFWLGKKAIELFTKQADGRLDKSPIYHILKDRFKIENDREIVDIILNKFHMDRREVASISTDLRLAADKGDLFAIEYFKMAAYEYYLIVKSLIEQLDFNKKEDILVSYSGGVFKSGKYILNPFKNYLENLGDNIKVVKPILSPVSGAALYSMKIVLGELKDEAIRKLSLEK